MSSPGWQVVWDQEAKHIIPVQDRQIHRLHDCWCAPTFNAGDKETVVWIHHAADRRESFECDEG